MTEQRQWIVDSLPVGGFRSHATCLMGNMQLGEFHLQVVQLFQKLFLLAAKVLSPNLGYGCTSVCQLLVALVTSAIFKYTSDYMGPKQIIQNNLSV